MRWKLATLTALEQTAAVARRLRPAGLASPMSKPWAGDYVNLRCTRPA